MKLKQVLQISHKAMFNKTATGPGDVEWLLEDHGDCLVVAFRGTEFFKGKWFVDTLRNIASMLPWRLKGIGWGGMGYMLGAKTAVDELIQHLYEHGVNYNKPVIVCGHSMGAAISFYASLLLHQQSIPIKAWVGTGSPNCSFKRHLVLPFKCYNMKYGSDVVSSYPPRIFGFNQPYTVTYLGETSFFNFGNFKHHDIGLYIDNVPDVTL